jgi:predicted O-methyltransferase YrrM
MKKQRQIEFVGDLSIEDSNVLMQLGKDSDLILEFGVGGSTQIFAQCKPRVLLSVETDSAWAYAVADRIATHLPQATQPVVIGYGDRFYQKFDLIFVDGIDDKRLDFALNTWDSLNHGGKMLFHDTRRQKDLLNALKVAERFREEVESVAFNFLNSNITVLHKRKDKLIYENWNITEGLPLSAYSLLEGQE